jgi:hypothetical protein
METLKAINERASDLQEVRTLKNCSILDAWVVETFSEKSEERKKYDLYVNKYY